MDFTFEINAQVHTLLVNFFFQPPQPQSMMQRQLGTSQLPNSSSHRGSMMAPPTNGNMRNRQVCYYWCLYTIHIMLKKFVKLISPKKSYL